MSTPVRPDPMAAAARVTGVARDLASDLTENFRRSDSGFKLRAVVVATFAVLSLVTFWVACPSTVGPANSLGAVVRLDPESIMGTQIMVHNNSERMWTDVVLTLDDTWRFEQRTMRAGDRLVLSTTRFQRQGQPAPRDLKPKVLVVECEQGKATTVLGAKR
jgi:hypothetical protein